MDPVAGEREEGGMGEKRGDEVGGRYQESRGGECRKLLAPVITASRGTWD